MASKKRRQYADRELARSVERVVVGGEKAAAVSREANIPYRTLAKYVRRARAGESIARRRTGPPPMLTSDGERRLLEWMLELQRQGLPVRRRELMEKANELLRENATATNEQLSAGWYKRFRQRHPEVTGSSTDLAVDSECAVSVAAGSSGSSEVNDSEQPTPTVEDTASSGDADVSSASKDPVVTVAPSPRQVEDLSPMERAVLLLQDQYAAKMDACDVVEAFDVMLDPLKARVFLIMAAGVGRDVWLRNQIAKAREKKRTPIDIWRKQEVIRWIDNEGGGVPTRAVKHFRSLGWSIDGGAVRKWWRARDEILAADPKTRRLPGAGRKKASLGGGGGGGLDGGSGASTTSSVDHEYESRSLGGGETDAVSAPASSAGVVAAAAFQLSLPMETDESMPASVAGGSPRPTESHQMPQQQQQQQAVTTAADTTLTPTIAPLTPSERAVQLLQRRYSGKLTDDDVVEAFDVMLDLMKARIFLIMTPGEQRDLWLLRQIEKRRLAAANGGAGPGSSSAASSGDRVV